VEIVSYKARVFGDPYLRTGAIMAMVLFGGSLVGFVVAPLIGRLVATMQRSSRQGAGELGEIFFLLFLGAVVFWLYYRVHHRPGIGAPSGVAQPEVLNSADSEPRSCKVKVENWTDDPSFSEGAGVCTVAG